MNDLRTAIETHLRWLRFHVTEPHVDANETARISYQHAADMLQCLLTEQSPHHDTITFDESLPCKLELVVEVLVSVGACSAATIVREAITALASVSESKAVAPNELESAP